MTKASDIDGIRFRRPTEADHARLVGIVDDWWAERGIHRQLPRLWFRHFTATSWIAEEPGGRVAGFLVGFVSPDDRSTGYVHMIGIDPNRRRRGLGRALYDRFAADVAAAGVRRVSTVTWPGNRVSVAFHRAIGFEPVAGPGTQNLYGTRAFADYDGDGEDRVVLERLVTAER